MSIDFVTQPIPGSGDDLPKDDPPAYDDMETDPDAPYGRTKTGRIRKHPVGSTTRARGNMPASETMARQAAALLATVNGLVGLVLNPFLPETADVLHEANRPGFEEAAYTALLMDPALCRKILGGGKQSGAVMLALAYGGLGVAIAPTAKDEITKRRAERLTETDTL